jgi:chanoclavine-I dehydrogenase
MSASLFSLGSRVFSVTGGASGMGAATVRLLAQHGAGAIWIADWNDGNFGQIKEDAERINPLTKIHTHKVDVSDPKQVDDWVASIIAESGALHGAANVAGLSQPAFSEKKPAILAETNEDWARVLGVNLQGIMYCTRAQVAAMVDAPKGSHPAIVNVSSIASLLRGPSAFAYGASKTACAHFTSCVAKDIHSFGIRVNTVSPGKSLNGLISLKTEADP